MQGLGTGPIVALRLGRAEARATCRRCARASAIAAFALSEPEAGSDVAALATTADAGRQRPCPPRRREDLDLERRHRRPLRRLRPHRRGAGRARALGLRGRGRHAGPDRRRAHRGGRAPSAGDAALRRLPRPGRRTGSAARARASRSRWRRSTCSARRSARRRSASRAARSTRRSAAPRRASCSARRSATCS